MELRQLKTFQTVANTLSFTRTATLLDYAQSSVTTQIQTLEEELGVQLFDRVGKKVVLTDAGERLLSYADRMLSIAQEAQLTITNSTDPSGTLTISSPESFCAYRLPKTLREFHRRYPQVRLIFCPESLDDIKRGRTDMAFMLGDLQTTDLVVEPLLIEPLMLVTAPDHHLLQLGEITSNEMQGETLLLTEADCTYRALFEQTLKMAKVRPGTILEFHSVEAIKQCAMAGMGVAVLPKMAVAAELAEGCLTALPWVGPCLEITAQMIWHKDRWVSPAMQAFQEISREILKTCY